MFHLKLNKYSLPGSPGVVLVHAGYQRKFIARSPHEKIKSRNHMHLKAIFELEPDTMHYWVSGSIIFGEKIKRREIAGEEEIRKVLRK
jgi:hypothetical protein